MSGTALQPAFDLVQELDRAILATNDTTRCHRIKEVLQLAVEAGAGLLAPRFFAPAVEGYARRLLHRDPSGRYSVVVMVWGRGQGTPLHDHAGRWCVECVYRGRIRVESFARIADRDSTREIWDFRSEGDLVTGVGDAGALIPPFEYHRLSNPDSTPAVTIHVYGGELDGCNVYEPAPNGGYHRVRKPLAYTPE
jgi:predicted metal-dependent enzyme (double-stranded beta helix superfamily)